MSKIPKYYFEICLKSPILILHICPKSPYLKKTGARRLEHQNHLSVPPQLRPPTPNPCVGASIYGAPCYTHNPRFPNHKDAMISSGYGNRNGFGGFFGVVKFRGLRGRHKWTPLRKLFSDHCGTPEPSLCSSPITKSFDTDLTDYMDLRGFFFFVGDAACVVPMLSAPVAVLYNQIITIPV